jgi:hypothetical protein
MKYRVEGYIQVPVEVIVEADTPTEAMDAAHQAVSEEFPPYTSILPTNEDIRLDRGTVISVSDDYEYDMQTADELDDLAD